MEYTYPYCPIRWDEWNVMFSPRHQRWTSLVCTNDIQYIRYIIQISPWSLKQHNFPFPIPTSISQINVLAIKNTHNQRSTEASLIPKCKFRPSKPNETIPHQCKQRPHLATLKWPNIYMTTWESRMEVVGTELTGKPKMTTFFPCKHKDSKQRIPGQHN